MCSTFNRGKPDGCRQRNSKISSRTSRCPAPTLYLCLACFGSHRVQPVGRPAPSTVSRNPHVCVGGHDIVLLCLGLSVAQALRSQKTKMREGLKQAIRLATEAEAHGGASAVCAPPKKRAAVVECSAIEARALHGALYDARRDNPREAHPGPLEKRRRLAQQEPAGCDISAAGCWERGDKHVEALEWQI